MRLRKIVTWTFYGLYSFGLTISVLPVLFKSFTIGTVALLYTFIAQGWLIFINQKKWTNFWKSNIFHLIPFAVFLYLVLARLSAVMFVSGDPVESARIVGSLLLLTLPFVPVVVQYYLFRMVYANTGIAPDD